MLENLKKNPFTFIMFAFGILMVLGGMDPLMAADENPLTVMKNVAIQQTTENVLPMAIMWIIGFSAIFAFALKSPYPLFLGGVAVLFLALGPDIAPMFSGYDFTAEVDG